MDGRSRSSTKTREIQARVDDYLDDKIQTASDLEDVNALILRVQEQQNMLKKQFEEALSALAQAQQHADAQAKALKQRAEIFQQQQSDVDSRLKKITGSKDSDDAVKTFESRMTKLRRLKIATGYLELFQEVETLSIDTKKALTADPRTALTRYSRLRGLTRGLQQAQPEAEGAAPHLVHHAEQATAKLSDEIRTGFVKDFQSTLEKMKWPQKELNPLGGVLRTWSEQTSLLLELQEPDLLAQQDTTKRHGSQILLPLEVMIQPLAQRFRYHFFGDKPTNRLDKPEYWLSHVLDLIDRHSSFMTEALQPVLDERFRALDELDFIYPDAISAFITAVLPLAMSKCLTVLPQVLSHPQLMSHFVHELMSFDNTLRDYWAYNPHPGVFADWKGLTWEVLNTHDYFNTWLSVEKAFALERYRTIRDSPESTDIDYDGVALGQTKPTKGAIRVNDLLETVTNRYRGLSSFSQKMKFLIGIQLSIFDDYHQHLHGALQAYKASSHTAGRLLQGQSKSEALGEKGLTSLCKIYGSAEFIERKMSDWGDDIFFLELWEELQDRAKSRDSARSTVGKDLSVDEVAAKTSATIKQNDNPEVEIEGGALFDETASSYQRLKELANDEILRLLDINIKDAVLPLGNVETWASLSTPTADLSALSPSSALDGLLQTISILLGFLQKVMAPAPLRKAAKHFCSSMHKEIVDTVILRHNFSAAGVCQLKRDVLALENAVHSATSTRGIATSSMRRLNQAVQLLGLPIKGSVSVAVQRQENNWGFDDEDTDGEDVGTSAAADEDRVWSLWDAEKAMFKSNEAARHALSEMGLDLLSENDARNILKKRVEISS